MHPTYLTVRAWIARNWGYTNQVIATAILDIMIKETKNVQEIKQAIVAEMKRQNGICLISV